MQQRKKIEDLTPDEDGIRHALDHIMPRGEGVVVEVRALGVRLEGERFRKAQNFTGWYDDPDALVDDVMSLRRGEGVTSSGIYITPNPVKRGLLYKSSNTLARSRSTTTDDDISSRRWLLVDCDPDCVVDGDVIKGIPSSHAEHAEALELATAIKGAMMAGGWPAPILASSGNGAHLMWRIDLANAVDALELINDVLASLDARFSVDGVKVDCSVGNAARIWKLYGTPSWKGSQAPEDGRTQRVSAIYQAPVDGCEVVSLEQLEQLADVIRDRRRVEAEAKESEKRERSSSTTNQRPTPSSSSPSGRVVVADMDVEAFVDAHLSVARTGALKGTGRRWVLSVCPFTASHTDNSAFVGLQPSGALVAGCHHDSCSWCWRELREHYQPEAAERRRRAEDYQARPPASPMPPRVADEASAPTTPSEPSTPDKPPTPAMSSTTLPIWTTQPTEAKMAHRLGVELDGAGERVVYADGKLWRYDPARGVWGVVGDHEALCLVFAWDGEPIGDDDDEVRIGARNSAAALSILKTLRTAEGIDFFERRAFGFCLGGQYIKADPEAGTVTVEALSCHWRVTAALECEYDPEATGELLTRYLSTVHSGHDDGGDRVRLMGEACFAALCGLGPRFGKAFLCFGKQGTGKSQYLNIISGLIPRELRCSIQPHALSDDYKGAMLAGKQLNVVHECDEGSVMREAGFKATVTGDAITRRRIRDAPLTFIPQALHMFAGNRLPPAPGVSDAFIIRWLLLGFERRFRDTKADVRDIGAKIIKGELEAVVAWAVECGRGLLERGKYTTPSSTSAIFERWRVESDNVAAWAEDWGQHLETDRVRAWPTLGDLYKAYSTWALEGGFKRVNKTNFSGRLEGAGYERAKSNGVRFRITEKLDETPF